MTFKGKSWIAWVLAGAAVPPAIVLATGHTLVWRDTARIHAPLRGLVVEALRDGRLPLWNPFESCGSPLFAQMVHSVLHPVSLAWALLAPGAGPDVAVVAYVLLAALGAAVLARSLGASDAAAVAGGLAYGLSGYVLSMATVLHYLAAAATAPWVVAALRGASAGPGRFAAAGLAMAAAHFAGDPQWALVAALLGLPLAGATGGGRGLAAASGAVLAGTALAGVQLAPAWELLGESMRGTAALPAAERALWSLAPARVAEFVAPGFFSGRPGLLVAPVFVALGGAPREPGALLPTYTLPFVISIFVGAPVLWLAVSGALASRAGKVLAAASVVLLWLAFGADLGAQQALGGVPLWGAFRYAEKLVGPFTLCLAVLAALGVDRLARAPSRRVPWGAVAAALAAGMAAAILALGPGPLTPWRDPLALGLVHATLSMAGLAGILVAGAGMRGRLNLLAALVFAQSAAAAPFALHAGARDARATAPHAELLGTAPVVRIGTPLRGVSRWQPADLDPHDGMLELESRLGVAPFPAAVGIDQIDTYTALVPRPVSVVNSVLGTERDPEFWRRRRRFGLTHVAIREPLGPRERERADAAASGGRLAGRDLDRHFTVHAVPHRAWAAFAAGAVTVQGEAAMQTALADLAPATWDTVVLEGEPPAAFSPGRIRSTARAPERIVIDAEADGPGLLVVNDTFAAGWGATIDGQPVPILRADGLVRAVQWPGGRHVVEMRYRPGSVRLGFWISGLAVAVLLAAAGVRIVRRI